MSLTPGTRIGPYEVISLVGVGGMGEVYKARDPKLQRDVALKILPEVFASDPDRLARFEREARTLAALSHPHIAGIYGFEESHGVHALALEFVAGESLADLIARGSIPIDEALPIGRQIAEALEAAHEQGIIHRDLKPANIRIASDGVVKVLDFGLAKLVDAPGAPTSTSPSVSPTITSPALMTQAGMLLGTAAYMSPEQARGVTVDKRADLWALGCILYEMLAERRTFGGELASDVMASVLKSEPDYAALPPMMPARLLALIQRCLQKDPKKRWRDAGDVRAELELVGAAPAEMVRDARPAPVRTRERLFWSSGIVLAVLATWSAIALFDAAGSSEPAAPAGNLVRFRVSPPDGTSLYAGGWIVPFALSPDGRWLAFTATSDDGRSRLWVRPMGSDDAQVVQGTEGATSPFWSPTSEWLGFAARNVWYRVRIPGGAPEIIRAIPYFTYNPTNAAWGDGGDRVLGRQRRALAGAGAGRAAVASHHAGFLEGRTLPPVATVPEGRPALSLSRAEYARPCLRGIPRSRPTHSGHGAAGIEFNDQVRGGSSLLRREHGAVGAAVRRGRPSPRRKSPTVGERSPGGGRPRCGVIFSFRDGCSCVLDAASDPAGRAAPMDRSKRQSPRTRGVALGVRRFRSVEKRIQVVVGTSRQGCDRALGDGSGRRRGGKRLSPLCERIHGAGLEA